MLKILGYKRAEIQKINNNVKKKKKVIIKN